MPAEGSLKRLGGGRWETRDGRFAIEPQSGTWVVVDNNQTDDLGLPLVRGPFGSLTAAKQAIAGAREIGRVESPLAERLKQARTTRDKPGSRPARRDGAAGREGTRPEARRAPDRDVNAKPAAGVAPEPAAPEEPRWLRDLTPTDRRRARELIERLASLDLADPGGIARAEIARNQPAIARQALERGIRKAIAGSTDPAEAGRAVVAVILRQRDKDFGVGWRLVDDRGRAIDELDISD
jgi:hypothetical protein